MGGIIGGNTFAVLFLTFSNVGYRDGSIYHAIGKTDLFRLVVRMVIPAVLILGMLYRQRHGPAGIGIESLLILATCGGAIATRML